MGFLLVILGIVVVLIGTGVVYQNITTRRDKQRFQPPGRLVDAGGYRLHLLVMGDDKPGPTVILDAGMVSFSSNWAWVQPEIAKVARVVAYDRAGLGWSDPGPEPRDAAQSASELQIALQKAGITGPYIVVGHSYGGLTARAFADMCPDDVVGMVLVDASHPDQWRHIPASKDGKRIAAAQGMARRLAGIGLFRVWDKEAETLAAGLPPQQYAEIKAFCMQPESLAVSSNALSVWDERTRPQINHAGSLGNMPVFVLSVTEQAMYADVLTQLQAELSKLSTNSRHVTVQGATHEGLVSQREYAQAVTDAILQVVEAARTGEPLALDG